MEFFPKGSAGVMGPCCSRQIGQGPSRTGGPPGEMTVELTTTESGRKVMRLSKRRAISRNRKEIIMNLHIDNATRTGACSLDNMMLMEVKRGSEWCVSERATWFVRQLKEDLPCFAQFPKELERISKVLRNLDLSSNKLPELPPVISLFSMLKSLNCDDNRIGEYINTFMYLYPWLFVHGRTSSLFCFCQNKYRTSYTS